MVEIVLSSKEKEGRKKIKQQELWVNTHKNIDGIDYKVCSECNEWLPSTEEYFYKNKKNNVDGLFPYCRVCAIEKSKKNQEDNKDRKRLYDKKRYVEHEDYYKEKAAKWDSENREQKQKILKRWQRNNPDIVKNYNLNRQHKEHDITKEEWYHCKKYFDFCCAYCGLKEEEHREIYSQQLHRDHADHDGANDLSNCIPSCKSCNGSKRTYELDEWFLKSDNYTEERWGKIQEWLNKDYKKYIKKDYTTIKL